MALYALQLSALIATGKNCSSGWCLHHYFPQPFFLVIHRCAEKPLCKVLKKAVARILFFYQCNHTEVWCLQGAAELGLGSSSTISMGQIISPYECHSVTLSCLTHSSWENKREKSSAKSFYTLRSRMPELTSVKTHLP